MSDESAPNADALAHAETTAEYSHMIDQLDGAIAEVTDKIENGRIRNPEHERVRVQYYKALGYLLRTKREVLQDKTLEELAAEIEALKDAQTAGEDTPADLAEALSA
ncbi:hypothetical protein [Halomarina pelagica]|uniref:hypothetical protein n=1 Tax=Halomarina pelagica TaxID=2961599 RepID=UPI0020C4384A|nr:hypothetical protein [Halomarina sp. BND7]